MAWPQATGYTGRGVHVEPPYKNSTKRNRWWLSSGVIVASQIAVVVLLRASGNESVYVEVLALFVLFLVMGLALRGLARQERALSMFWPWLMELLVTAIPFIGLWELFQTGESLATGRLAILFIFILCLSLLALITGYIEHNRLFSALSDATAKRGQLEQERRGVSGRLIRAQEVERSRIGRELHNNLSQQVALLAFGLSQLSKRMTTNKLRLEVLRLLEGTKRLSDDVHRLSHELHSPVLDHLGLVAAAQTLCDEVSRQHKIAVHFTETNLPAALCPEISLCLFRTLQEALSNISKHSRGNFAHVMLMGSPDGVFLAAQDDGIGFDPTDKRNRGLGLLRMSERLYLVGGALVIDSAPSCGTTVKVWVPTKPADVPRDVHAPDTPKTFAKPGTLGTVDGMSTGTLGG